MQYLGDFASCSFCNCAVFVRCFVCVLKRGTDYSLIGVVVVWYDIGVVALMVFRFVGCAILFFALVVGISLAVVGLSDVTHDDFRDVMSFIAITETLCLVAAALLVFLYGI